MSCTRRGFLKTVGAAMIGLGVTRIDGIRGAFAVSSTAGPTENAILGGGPASGPFSIESLRVAAAQAAFHAGDPKLADELRDVCCWAPAAAAIRERPLAVQRKGAEYFFRDFPGGDQLADVLFHANNTTWQRPQFRFDPETLVAKHYDALQKSQTGIKTEVVSIDKLQGRGRNGDLGLMLDRKTGEQLQSTADRSQELWASLSIFSGILLDPTEGLSNRLQPFISLRRADDRALSRAAAVRYSQTVLGSVQRALWSDQLGDKNPALPLVRLSSAGFLPLGEEHGQFLLLNLGGGKRVTGYRTAGI
jgi:hypothetical protein